MSGLIDDTMVRTIAVVGTPDECAQRDCRPVRRLSPSRVCCYFPGYPGQRRTHRQTRDRDQTTQRPEEFQPMTYGFETTTDEVIDGVDLTGKIAVVTGASAGIGVETARALAAAGAHVVLAARNAERTEAAAESIRERVPGAELEVGMLDLTSLDSVRAFAGVVPRTPRRVAVARQQRRGHVHALRAHRRRLRDAVRHQPRRPLPAHVPARPRAPRRRTLTSGEPELRWPHGLRHRLGRSQLRAARLRQVRAPTGSRRRPTSSSASSSTVAWPTAACTPMRCTPA